MRAAWILALTVTAALAGCATKHQPPAIASCPALTDEQWSPVLLQTLKTTFGKTSYHVIADQGTDARGDFVLTASRVGPASFAMPEPGRGGSLMIVFDRCTAKVLKVRKLAPLEVHPSPLPEPEANTP